MANENPNSMWRRRGSHRLPKAYRNAAVSETSSSDHLARRSESQTVIEDAIKVVVINSQHPLFRERKGDIWYQLETAASEICKSIEGVTVADYERRVNEIVLLAFRLRGRRRKTRTPAAQLKILQQATDKTSE